MPVALICYNYYIEIVKGCDIKVKLIKALSYIHFLFLIISLPTACFASGSMMQQSSSTSQGTIQRHIDISSPWSGAYIYENSKVVGTATVTESFSMDNLPPGPDAGSGSVADTEIGVTGSGSGSSSGSGTGRSTTVLGESIEGQESNSVASKEFAASKKPGWLELF